MTQLILSIEAIAPFVSLALLTIGLFALGKLKKMKQEPDGGWNKRYCDKGGHSLRSLVNGPNHRRFWNRQ